MKNAKDKETVVADEMKIKCSRCGEVTIEQALKCLLDRKWWHEITIGNSVSVQGNNDGYFWFWFEGYEVLVETPKNALKLVMILEAWKSITHIVEQLHNTMKAYGWIADET